MNDKEIRNISSFRLFIQNFSRKKLGVVCVILVFSIYLIGIFAPVIAPYDYSETNLLKTQSGPDMENLLGTDRLGRDILLRVIWGIQTTVIVTITGLLTGALILGLFLGLLAGFYRGIFDFIVMRTGELVSSFPDILLIILLAATLRPRITNFFYQIEDNLNISGLVSSGIIDYLVIGIARSSAT